MKKTSRESILRLASRGGEMMKIVVKGNPKEIAALAAQLQGRQEQSIVIGSPKLADRNGDNLAQKNRQSVNVKSLAWCW